MQAGDRRRRARGRLLVAAPPCPQECALTGMHPKHGHSVPAAAHAVVVRWAVCGLVRPAQPSPAQGVGAGQAGMVGCVHCWLVTTAAVVAPVACAPAWHRPRSSWRTSAPRAACTTAAAVPRKAHSTGQLRQLGASNARVCVRRHAAARQVQERAPAAQSSTDTAQHSMLTRRLTRALPAALHAGRCTYVRYAAARPSAGHAMHIALRPVGGPPRHAANSSCSAPRGLPRCTARAPWSAAPTPSQWPPP